MKLYVCICFGDVQKSSVCFEKSPSLTNDPEIIYVEILGAPGVHLNNGGRVRRGASPPQGRCVVRIHAWIRVVSPREVVETVREGVAVGNSDCVPSWTKKKQYMCMNSRIRCYSVSDLGFCLILRMGVKIFTLYYYTTNSCTHDCCIFFTEYYN